MELYPAAAPKTVSNFLQYVKSKHYSGTIFHRVISNFMVQGGGYDAKYAEKATRTPVAHEGREALKAGLLPIYLRSLRAHGCTLSDARIAELLAIDLELNAQGMAVWLDRAA